MGSDGDDAVIVDAAEELGGEHDFSQSTQEEGKVKGMKEVCTWLHL